MVFGGEGFDGLLLKGEDQNNAGPVIVGRTGNDPAGPHLGIKGSRIDVEQVEAIIEGGGFLGDAAEHPGGDPRRVLVLFGNADQDSDSSRLGFTRGLPVAEGIVVVAVVEGEFQDLGPSLGIDFRVVGKTP